MAVLISRSCFPTARSKKCATKSVDSSRSSGATAATSSHPHIRCSRTSPQKTLSLCSLIISNKTSHRTIAAAFEVSYATFC